MKVKTIVDANPLKADFEGQYEVYVIPASEPVDLSKLAEQFCLEKVANELWKASDFGYICTWDFLSTKKPDDGRLRQKFLNQADAIIEAVRSGSIFK